MTDYNHRSVYDIAPRLKRDHRQRRSKLSRRARKMWKRLVSLTNWQVVLPLFISVIAVLTVGAAALVMNARRQVETSIAGLERTIEVLDKPGNEWTLTDLSRVQGSLQDVTRTLSSLQSQTRLLRPLTPLNATLNSNALALDATLELARAADDLLTGLQPTLFYLVAGEDSEVVVNGLSSGERMVELLQIGQARFLRAESRLANVDALLASIDEAVLSPDLLLSLEVLNDYTGQLRDINTMLLNAPDLLTNALGLTQSRNYLVLAQNSDELRPSGGYIGTYGWFTVRSGRVTNYDYSPTTITSPNPPPQELAEEIQVPDWWLRFEEPLSAAWDGSWYADFPATAALAKWYYDNGGNEPSPIDAVIAIDLVGFEYILGALGQVEVDEYDVTITAETFRELVYTVRAEGEAELEHKQFLAAIYQQIFADWQATSRDQHMSTQLLGAALKALQEKHIMLYFASDALNDAVRTLGWSGSQTDATDHDYLMIADANLGNKSNRSVVRQLTYDVAIANDGALTSRVAVTYDYPAYLADADPAVDPEHHGDIDYNNLMQMFVPHGSTLTGTGNLFAPVQSVESDTHTLFVTAFQVPYDDSRRYQLSYSIPPLIEELGPYRRYRLLLQKQPGRLSESVNVQLALPSGAQLIHAEPAPVTSYNLDRSILDFRFNMVKDQWLEVIYAPAG